MRAAKLARFAAVGAACGLVLVSALAATNTVSASRAERDVTTITVDQKKPQYLLVMPDWDRDLLHINPADHKDRFELVKVYPAARIRREPYLLYRLINPEEPLP